MASEMGSDATQAKLLSSRGELRSARYNFEARLPSPRRQHDRLGVRLLITPRCQLQVDSKADEGSHRPSMVAEWNRMHAHKQPDKCILVGDRISAVNNEFAFDDMLEQIHTTPRVIVTIERDDPTNLVPAPKLAGQVGNFDLINASPSIIRQESEESSVMFGNMLTPPRRGSRAQSKCSTGTTPSREPSTRPSTRESSPRPSMQGHLPIIASARAATPLQSRARRPSASGWTDPSRKIQTPLSIDLLEHSNMMRKRPPI